MGKSVLGRGRKWLVEVDDATGQRTATLTLHDQHYRDAQGAWQPVEEGLVDDGSDWFAKRCDRTAHAIRIGAGGAQRWYPRRNVLSEYVDITQIQYWRTQGAGSWQTINLPTPVWRSGGADWDLANLRATLTHTWNQLKTSFVLKNATAPTRLRFALTLVGLTFGEDWHFTSTTDAVDVGSLPPPRFTDATDADVPVTTVWANGAIEWAVNPAGATYPLTSHSITFTDGYGGDTTTACETFITSNAPTNNYGTAGYFTVAEVYNALLKFDLSDIDSGATCESATLYTYEASSQPNARTISVYEIASANQGWTETGATWNTRDGSNYWAGDTGSDGGADAGCSVSGTDYAATALGSYVAADMQATDTENTASLTAASIEAVFGGALHLLLRNPGTTHQCRSSDYFSTSLRPKLVVVYSSGTAQALESSANITASGAAALSTRVALTSAASITSTATAVVTAPGPATTQTAYPTSDVADGSWTPSTGSDLFACVDEAAASDTDYIRSGATPEQDAAVLALGALDTPEAGDVTLSIRARWVT